MDSTYLFDMPVPSVDCTSCEGNVIWRGHFDATGKETGVNLTINGGTGK